MPKAKSAVPGNSPTTSAPAVSPRRVDAAHGPPRPDDLGPGPADRGEAQVELLAVDATDQGVIACEPTVDAGQRAEQLEYQAEQLAAWLQDRQRELDRREAQLYAGAAQWEREQRAARLDLDERRHELAEWEASLRQRTAILDQKASALAAAEVAAERSTDQVQDHWQQRSEELQRQAADLQQREQQLRREAQSIQQAEQRRCEAERLLKHEADVQRQQWQLRSLALQRLRRQLLQHIEQRRQALEKVVPARVITASAPVAAPGLQPARPQLSPPDSVRQESLQRLAEREQQLDQLYQLLESQLADARAERAALARQRGNYESEKQQQIDALKDQAERQQAELARRQARLVEQRDWLKEQVAVLQQARRELRDLHSQSLELRLATEQLWTRLQNSAHPARLTRELGQVRAQITAILTEERKELQVKSGDVERATRQLVDQRREFQTAQARWQSWLQTRRQELEEQAARLIAREHELDARQTQLGDLQREWLKEKRGLQRQVTESLQQLRQLEPLPG